MTIESERPSPEQQARDFAAALEAIRSGAALTIPQLDALALAGDTLQDFDAVWAEFSSARRAELIRQLAEAAQQRLRLDFSAVNHRALSDPSAQVRKAAVESAIEDRSSALLDRLLDLATTDESFEVRRAAVADLARFTLLAELGDLPEDSANRLRDVLGQIPANESEAPGVRAEALAALGYLGEVAVSAGLARWFTVPDMRLGAVRGMGRSADPAWTDRLMPVLGSEDPDLREAAAVALGEIEDERAVNALGDLVDDPDPEVRRAVLAALGSIGGEAARETLVYALQDPDPEIQRAAEAAVADLDVADELPDI